MTDFTVTGMLTVDGSSTLRSDLTSTNFSRLQAVAVQGALDVSGPAELFGGLTAPSIVFEKSVNVSAPTEVRKGTFQGLVVCQSDATIKKALDNKGNMILGSLVSSGSALAVVGGGAAVGSLQGDDSVTVTGVTACDALTCTSTAVLGTVVALRSNVASGTAQVLRVSGDYHFLGDGLETNFLSAGNWVVSGDGVGNAASVTDYVFVDSDAEAQTMTWTDRMSLSPPPAPPTVTAQAFVDPTGVPISATAALAPGSTSAMGQIVITGLATEVMGSFSDTIATFLTVTLNVPLVRAPFLRLQAGPSWVEYPLLFWSQAVDATSFTLKIPAGSSQTLPAGGVLLLTYMLLAV